MVYRNLAEVDNMLDYSKVNGLFCTATVRSVGGKRGQSYVATTRRAFVSVSKIDWRNRSRSTKYL